MGRKRKYKRINSYRSRQRIKNKTKKQRKEGQRRETGDECRLFFGGNGPVAPKGVFGNESVWTHMRHVDSKAPMLQPPLLFLILFICKACYFFYIFPIFIYLLLPFAYSPIPISHYFLSYLFLWRVSFNVIPLFTHLLIPFSFHQSQFPIVFS